tara:strand:- start:8169 stop:8609 length:441 start_codon:yes stop_codon:yes gene_type:complete
MENPFAGQDIQILSAYREKLESFVARREGKNASYLSHPFDRNVDIWFAAIMLAVRKGIAPVPVQGVSYKAAEGTVLGSDVWRATALCMLAIAHHDNAEIVDSPPDMMRLANGLANAGFPELFSLLDQRGNDTALDFLCDEISKLVD